jgi:DNA invertase Pin-like site-specific DNA recombinase
MTFEPGEDFPWGLWVRRSAYNRRETEDGEVELFEESTDRQEWILTEHIKRHKLGRIVGTYGEVKSAYQQGVKRRDFEDALDDLKAGRIGGIAAWRPDRLVRRMSQFDRVLAALEQSGGRLLCLSPMLIDTGDVEHAPTTRLFLQFLVAVAEMESEAEGERISLMHAQRAKKGLVQPSSVRPFGHTDDWFGLVDSEVKILHEAGRRLLEGEAAFSVAADFTARAIPKPNGNTRWGSNVLRRMLLSPRMVGERQYGDKLYDLHGVPPIFEDREEWERICAKLASRGKRSGPMETHLLSSIAQCGLCDRTLAYHTSGRKSSPAYVCRPRFEGDKACRKISVSAPHADDQVNALVVKFLADHDRVNALIRQHADGADLDAINARYAELQDAKLELEEDHYNPPPGVKRVERDRYLALRAAIEEEQEQLHRWKAVNREAALLAEVLTFEDAEKEWGTRGLHWRRSILKLICASIVIEPRGKLLPKDDPRFRPGFNGFDPERIRVTFADE